MQVRGADLESFELGTGPPAVLVHGAPSDYRMWLPHCELLAPRYRVVAYSQRYFGTAPWRDGWPAFGVRTHADDLVALVQALDAGPAHVIAWSYGAHVALTAACEQPRLFRSVFLYEPGFPTYVTDAEELAEFAADAQRMFGAAAAALREDGAESATRVLIDESAQRSGYFDAQPPEWRRVQLANARVIPLLFSQTPPPELTCAQLRSLATRTAVFWGECTRPLFRIVASAAAKCIGNEDSREVPRHGHLWPEEDCSGFCALAARFIEGR